MPLHEILLSGRLKHQEMLSQKLHTALDPLLKGGSLGPLRVTQPEVAVTCDPSPTKGLVLCVHAPPTSFLNTLCLQLQAELVQILALPLGWDGAAVGPDQLPLSAPFSASIPELVRLLRR